MHTTIYLNYSSTQKPVNLYRFYANSKWHLANLPRNFTVAQAIAFMQQQLGFEGPVSVQHTKHYVLLTAAKMPAALIPLSSYRVAKVAYKQSI